MAMAKHFAVYSQETDRGELDDVVSARALQEIYLPPFKAAVTQAHVVDRHVRLPRAERHVPVPGPTLLGLLDQWGFAGFVRSDLGSVHDPVAALEPGPTCSNRPGPAAGHPGGRGAAPGRRWSTPR